MRYECTWSGTEIWTDPDGPSDGLSYGICSACVGAGARSVNRVTELDLVSADALPFGLVVLDADATVVVYNRPEAELSGLDQNAVIGTSFFGHVAPCTAVEDFQGRFNRLQRRKVTAVERFTFLFRFKEGDKLVRVSMAYDASSALTTLLVSLAPNAADGSVG